MVKLNGALILALSGSVLLSWLFVRRVASNHRILTIVPRPAHVEMRKGCFRLQSDARILADPFCIPEGQLLAQRLRFATGFEIPVEPPSTARPGCLRLTGAEANPALGSEGYQLEVTPSNAVIRAVTSTGIFYGTQSILQLLPPAIYSARPVQGKCWDMPCIQIEDQPRFRWRGLMLDVSRHFSSPAEIERILDEMAMHKLNTFHWHLADDQGWRIEIKKYPRLAQVGAWRKRIGFNLDPKAATAYGPDGRYGGYYTQSDIREIVEYARNRHITVVPEIEMPGHSSAALAAYPQFSCSLGPYTTDMTEAAAAGVYCAGKEETFQFLDDVLTEVMELFPGTFIHVGGDEVCKQNWKNCALCQARIAREGLKNEHELQTYFIQRIEQFVESHGKRLIGWSEIQNVHLAPSTIVMDWIGGGLEAARAGRDVVMSPEPYCYFDFYQSKDRSREPPAAGAFLPLERVYSFEPIPQNLAPDQQNHILGAQANLWTEYVPSLQQVEYMAFPRLCALAEVVWSPKDSRNWTDFTRRLSVQEQRLERLGVNYRRGP
jgi:hexosaminidase